MNVRSLVAVLGALLGIGCVPNITAVEVISTSNPEIDEACVTTNLKSSYDRYAGELNVGISGSYLLTFTLANNYEASEAQVGSRTLDTAQRLDFFLREYEIAYTCKDTASLCAGFPKIPNQIFRASGVAQAGGELIIVTDLLNAEVATKLGDALGSDKVQMVAGVKFRGVLGSGTSLETGAYEFPLTVYNAPKPTCSGSEILSVLGQKCFLMVGQDSDYYCVPTS